MELKKNKRTKPTNEVMIKLCQLILELYPEITFYYNFRCLNKAIRETFTIDTFLQKKALYHRDITKVPNGFLLAAFNQKTETQTMALVKKMNFEFSGIGDAHFVSALESEAFVDCLKNNIKEILLI